MNNNFSEIITNKFAAKFTAAYKGLSGRGKAKVLKYGSVIFKRWYYSALVNETTLSPAFIYNASQEISSVVSAPSVRPEISGARLKGFSTNENRYTVNNHPVVKDIKTLIELCSPDVELDEENHIGPMAEKISNLLSLGDPYYVEYLTAVAFALNLLRKTDAIYSNKAAITNNYTLFKKLNQEEALKKIVDASVKICSKNLNDALPKPIPFISEKGIVSLIKNPIAIDEIYVKTFRPFGVNVERLWNEYSEKSEEQSDEAQREFLSSAFLLGVILDKWFITPFGEYLKLIEPIYCFCYNFDDELGYLYDAIKTDGSVDTALFSPCAFYSFTQFGKMFFSSDINNSRIRPPAIPVSDLLYLLNIDAPSAEQSQNEKRIISKEVYTFKIKLLEDKRYWIRVNAAEYNTLHELHIEIALNFGFGFTGYSIYADETMNRFRKYSDPKSKVSGRKANSAVIEKLDLTKGRKMIYVSNTGSKLEIELITRVHLETGAHYPQTIKIGKYMCIGEE